ncbi:GGDEF domain-containing protein [Parahaliea mediterranea]|uniref:diguanylate cyclase n=1 Tax=Parahaliea mediterranea TaxID=651086 RepID=A0A939DIR1_9GAMM|nr:GGDEF domain-containing protein [Parahaliea mediterranea]MBN7798998.1 GGDEF domain-containing protein [Parahaliea mediterranea]
MSHTGAPAISLQPDIAILNRLRAIQPLLLSLVGLVAAVVMFAWWFPALGRALPDGWQLMKFNTALGMALCSLSLHLSGRGGRRRMRGAALAALLTVMLALSALGMHAWGGGLGLETLFAGDAESSRPGLMSLQTASYLLLAAVVALLIRQRKSRFSSLADALTGVLLTTCLVVLAGYVFGAARLFGQEAEVRTSPHTLACMLILAFVAVARRSEYGYFSVIVALGLGSKMARMLAPVALLLPFLLAYIAAHGAARGLMASPYALALSTTLTSLVFFLLVVLMARRINELENDLRDLSLKDELTGLFNRRGCYLLGEQSLRDARRARSTLSVLYFDLNHLKRVNDELGHDAGDRLLCEMVSVMKLGLRANDILARLGGDEFVAVIRGDLHESRRVVRRLRETARARAANSPLEQGVSFSVGSAASGEPGADTFDGLVRLADQRMYAQKQAFRRGLEPADDAAGPGLAMNG